MERHFGCVLGSGVAEDDNCTCSEGLLIGSLKYRYQNRILLCDDDGVKGVQKVDE